MMDTTDAIRMMDVVRKFGDHTAVDSLSMHVSQGEIFGLLGPNGAGKTTTLRLITGLLKRHQGEVLVFGYDPQKDPKPVRKRIGIVPQETNLYEDLTAVDNLWHHAALYCDDMAIVKARIEELLEWMQLWKRRKDPVKTFSGGMKRRLALARALLHDPVLILFDEPTLGVDVQGRHALWDHIHQQREGGKTFLISTNNMNEADALCDRLVIVDQGAAVIEGAPEEMKAAMGRDIVTLKTSASIDDPGTVFGNLPVHELEQSSTGELRFEIPDAETYIADIVNQLTRDYQLEWIRFAKPSLDDVFLHHTGRALRE